MLEVFGKTNIDFIGKRNIAFIFSGTLILLGVFAFVQIYRGSANLGIDFAGGAAIQLRFDQPIRIDEARKVLESNGFGDVAFQEFAGTNRLLVRIKKQEAMQGKVAEKIVRLFSDTFKGNKFQSESSSEIGPTIGRKLQKDAIVAIAISLIGIVIYIAVRFEFKFGIAAAIATFHDVLAVLGVTFILNKEITLLIVTALLTIAGYSLTDTVVVFDRIRENLKKRNRGDTLDQVLNSSINQVLGRTFMTSLTTLLAVAALYIFGGEVIHDFAFTLLVGIIVGTYSSWFVASPILFVWGSGREVVLKKAYR